MIELLSFSIKYKLGRIITLAILVFFNLQINAQIDDLDWNDGGNTINGAGIYNYSTEGDPNCVFNVEVEIGNIDIDPQFGTAIEQSAGLPDSDGDGVVLDVWGALSTENTTNSIKINFADCLTGVNFGITDIDLSETVAVRGIDCSGTTVFPVSVSSPGTANFLIYDPVTNNCSNCAGFTFPLTALNCLVAVNCVVPNTPCVNNPIMNYQTFVGGGLNENNTNTTINLDFGTQQISALEFLYTFVDFDGAYDCPDVTINNNDVSGLNGFGLPGGTEIIHLQIGEILYDTPACTTDALDWTDSGNAPNGSGQYNYPNLGNPNCPFDVELEVGNNVNVDPKFGTVVETNMGLPDSDGDGIVLDVWGERDNQSDNSILINFSQCKTGVQFGITEIDLSESVGIRGLDCNGTFVYPTITSPGNPNYLLYDPISNNCTNCTGFVFPLTATDCTGVLNCVAPNSPCTNNPYMNYQSIVGGGINSDNLDATAIIEFGTQQIVSIEIIYGYLQNDGAYDCPDATTNINDVSGINSSGNLEGNDISHIQIGEIIVDKTTICPLAEVNVIKSISSGPTLNPDGTYGVTYDIQIENTGSTTLNNVQITDVLTAFAPVSSSNISIIAGSLSPNPNYDGLTDANLLTGTDILLAGETASLSLQLILGPHSITPVTTNNTVEVTGEDSSGNVATDTDAVPTPFVAPMPTIEVAKNIISNPTLNIDGTYDVTFGFTIENTGDQNLNNIGLTDDLSAFAPINLTNIIINNGNITPSAIYDGITNLNLLVGSDALAPGETAMLSLVVNMGPYNSPISGISNTADVSGISPAFTTVTDNSSVAPAFLVPVSDIDITKTIASNPTLNTDGTYDVVFSFLLENTGNQNLVNVQITDDLSLFAPINAVNATLIGGLPLNQSYNGISDINLLAGIGIFAPGDNVAITLTVNMGPHNPSITGIDNVADATGTDSSGTTVTDSDTATPVLPTPSSDINITKTISSNPSLNADGTYDAIFSFTFENTGNQNLNNVQITDDLSIFSPINFAGVVQVSSNLSSNINYDGLGDINLLSGTDFLIPGETATANIEVNMGPHNPIIFGVNNVADVQATDPAGVMVSASDAVAPVFLSPNPSIEVSKSISSTPVLNADGTYDLTFNFVIKNSGDVDLNNVQLIDDLTPFAPINTILYANESANLSPNANYDGISNMNTLTGVDVLAPSETGTFELVLNIGPHNSTLSGIANICEVNATTPNVETVDNKDAVTPGFQAVTPALKIDKTLFDGPNLNANGTYDLSFKIEATNAGNVNLTDIQVIDDLSTYTPINSVNISNFSANLSPNGSFNGLSDLNTLLGIDNFAPGETGIFYIDINIGPYSTIPANLTNKAEVSGLSPSNVTVSDTDAQPSPISPPNTSIDVVKTLVNTPLLNINGTYDLVFKIDVENMGDVNLSNIQITDDLTIFSPINSVMVDNASANLSPNGLYNGLSDVNTLQGNDNFIPGQKGSFLIYANVGPYNNPPAVFTNVINANATDPSNQNINNTDDAAVSFTSPLSSIKIAKSILNGPTLNDDGTYDITFQINLENNGAVNLDNIQVGDDLTVFAPVNSAIITNTSSNLSPNSNYNGISNVNALNGNDTFVPGETGSFDISVNVGSFATVLTGISNRADATGIDPNGISVTDNTSEPVVFPQLNPGISVNKQILSGPILNNDGTYDISFIINVENAGNVELSNIQLEDDLSLYAPVNNANISNTSANLSSNGAYNGIVITNTLIGIDVLSPGESGAFNINVNFGPYSVTPIGLQNEIIAFSNDPTGVQFADTATVLSPILSPAPALNINKSIINQPSINVDGTYDVIYDIAIQNTGNVSLSNIQVADDLSVFNPVNSASVINTTANLSPNGSYNGLANINTLTGADVLLPGQSESLEILMNIGPFSTAPPTIDNIGSVSGNDPGGNNIVSNDTVPTVIPIPGPQLTVIKQLSSGPDLNDDGTYDMSFNITVENSGDLILDNIQVTDILSQYNPVNNVVVNNLSSNLSLNPNYNGVSVSNTLSGSDSFAPTESGNFEILINVGPFDPFPAVGSVSNIISGTATDPSNNIVNSDDEIVTDFPNVNPSIYINKTFIEDANPKADGTYDITFLIEIENTGIVNLYNVQIIDDLTSYSPVNSVSSTNSTGNIALNSLYDGINDVSLLFGNDVFIPGETANFEMTMNVGPFNSSVNLNTLQNEITVTSTDPNDKIISDDDIEMTELRSIFPTIEVRKNLTKGPDLKINGTYDLTFSIDVVNNGNVSLTNIQVVDDLSQFAPLNSVSIANTSANLSPNASFNGTSNINTLLGIDSFTPGELGSFDVVLNVGPYTTLPPNGIITNETSASGIDPSNNMQTNSASANSNFQNSMAAVDITKVLLNTPMLKADGTVDLRFNISVKNSGNVNLIDLQIEDDLIAYNPINSVSIINTSANISPNSSYNGISNINTLLGVDDFAPGETGTFDLIINVGPYDPTPNNVSNIAVVKATDPAGNIVQNDNTAPTTLPQQLPAIEVIKTLKGQPSINADGTYSLTYNIKVNNIGNADLNNLQLVDDLSALSPVNNVSFSNTSANISSNSGYDGITDTNILLGSNTLTPAENASIDLTVNSGPYNPTPASLSNLVEVISIDPSNLQVTDQDSANAILPTSSASITVLKEIIGNPILLSDGTQQTDYSITITNNGNVDLNNIQVIDDLNAFAPVNGVSLSNISANLSFNPGFNGTVNTNTLLGNNSLIPNETASFQISVNTGPYTSPIYGLSNEAFASGNDPTLNTVTDSSAVSSDYDISRPELGLAKELTSGPVLLSDGTFTITMRLLVENSGNVNISNIQITDDLMTTFSPPPTPNINYVLILNSSNNFNPNTSFDGQNNQNLLLGNDNLSIGEVGYVDIEINFGPMPPNTFTVFQNTANVTGIAPSGFQVEDNSHDGLNPDPEGDGPNDNDDPTPIPTKPPLGELGIAKELTSISNILPDGTYDITYTLFIENSGPVNILDIQIVDNLSTSFSGSASVPINEVNLTNSSSNLSPNGLYNGITNTDVLLGIDDFVPGETGLIQIKVNVGIVPQPGGDFANQAFVSGTDSDGSPINDSSDNGLDPDKDGDGPLNDNMPTIVTLEPGLSSIEITKSIVSVPNLNEDGTQDVIYNLKVQNTGYVPIENVQILDALINFTPLRQPIISNVTSNLDVNPIYDGIVNVNLLTGNDELAAGESGSLNLVLNIGPLSGNNNQITNYAIASANDDSGIQLFDDTSVITEFEVSEPKIDLEKKLINGPVPKIDGTYDISFRIELINTGDVVLNNLQVIDQLINYAPVNTINFLNISSNLSPNGSYNGISDLNMLNGTDNFVPGEEGSFDVFVNVGPLNNIPVDLKNIAIANGTDPGGNKVSDEDEIKTPVDAFEPTIRILKNLISDPVLNNDGTYSFTYLIQLINDGNVILNDIQINDDLNNFAPINAVFISNVSSNLTSNPAFNGITSTNLLSGTNSFQPGENGILNLTINAGPYVDIPSNLNNRAEVFAMASSGQAVDDSDIAQTQIGGIEPDIEVEKTLFAGPVLNPDGTYKMNFLIRVENTGNVTLQNFQLVDDINNYAPVISTAVTLPSSNFSINLNYDGLTNTNLLSGNDALAPGESGLLNLEVIAGPYPNLPVDSMNTVIGSAIDPLGNIITKLDSVSTPFQSLGMAGLNLDKLLIETPALQDDGTYNLAYFITVANIGSVNISDLQIEDDLALFQPLNNAFISSPTANLSPNPTYDGINNINTLAGNNVLIPGEVASFKLELNVGPYNSAVSSLVNLAKASGTEPTGNTIIDLDDEEAIFEVYRASINADKLLIEPPVLNEDGTYDFMFFINLSNTGNVNLSNIQVLDDLLAFEPVNSAFVLSPSANLSPNPVFNGLQNKNTLSGNDYLAPGEMASFALTVNAGPFNPTPSSLLNEIKVSGTDPINNLVEELDAALSSINSINPAISVNKNITSGPDYNSDGTYDILFTIETENTGDVVLNNIQLVDDLQQFQPLNSVDIINNTPNLSNNFVYDGVTDKNLLFGFDELNPGESGSVQLLINIGPYVAVPVDLNNSVNVFATAPNNIIVTERNKIPVPLQDLQQAIGLAKQLDALPVLNEDGSYDLQYSFIVENIGTILLNNIQITDDLSRFSPVNEAEVLFTSSNLSPNAFYDGTADIALLSGTDNLQPGEKGTFILSLNVGPYLSVPQGLINSATASASTPLNTTITDLSDDGIITDNLEDDPTPSPFSLSNPNLELVKALSSPPQMLADGSYDLSYIITIQNTGNILLNNVQLEDDLNAFQPLNEVQILNSSLNLSVNSNYNGLTDFNLLSGSDKLNPLEVARLTLNLNVGPFNGDTIIYNQSSASGISVDGMLTTDLSDDRTNATSDDDPTPAEFKIEEAEIGLAKAAKSVTPATVEGQYLVTYQFVLKNTGNIIVEDLSLIDDLTSSIGAAGSAYLLPLVQAPELISSNATVNPQMNNLFDGDSINNLLQTNTGVLKPDESITIEFTVEVVATESNNPIINSAIAHAKSADGSLMEDVSHQGTVPDPESDGAENNRIPTQVTLNAVDLVLEKSSNVLNNSPTVGDTVSFIIHVLNESPLEATNVAIEDQMPEGVRLINNETTIGTYNAFTNVWTIPNLPPNSTNRVMLDVVLEQAGDLINYAAIQQIDQPDIDLINNADETGFYVNEAYVEPLADLALTKLVDQANILVNDSTFFTIIISNNGPDEATNIVVEEILPISLNTLSITETSGNYNEFNDNWTIPAIAAGASDSLIISILATETGSFTNEASIISSDQTDPVFDNNRDEAIVFVDPIPEQPTADLSLNKTVSVNSILENSETAEFTILISNAGPDDATNIFIEEAIPAGLSYISHNTTKGTYNLNTSTWVISNLEAGTTEELSLSVSGEQLGTHTNTVSILNADQFDPVLTNNTSEADLSVIEVLEPSAELSLTKTVSDNAVMQNETITFTITISNAGPDEATNVVIEELMPEGLQYVDHTNTHGGYNVATGSWQLNSIPVGNSVSLTIEALAVDFGTLTNIAQIVESDQLDAVITNNRDEAVVFVEEVLEPYAELSLTKTVSDNAVMQNEMISFTITISNAGPNEATHVVVEELLPQGLQYVDHTNTHGGYNVATGSWQMNSIPAGNSVSLTIEALAVDFGTLTNIAQIVKSDQLDAVITNNRDEAVVFVEEVLEPYAELSLTKTVSDNAVMQNETITFTITISNAGPDEATNVVIEELMPEGLQYVAHTNTHGGYNVAIGSWQLNSIPVGNSVSLTIEALALDFGAITNIAQIVESDQLDAVITNNRDEAVVFVGEVLEPYAELSLTKTVSTNAIMQNESTRFDILISNAGPDAATNVSVEDILPQGLDYINHNTTIGNYDASTGLWTMLDLPSGASAVLSIDVLGVDAGTITNEAHIISSDQLDAVITNNRDEAVVFVGEVLEPYAELSLTKTVNANAIMQNETTRFDILISNAGPDAATNVSVEDILPQGLEYISHNTTVGNYNANTGMWTMLDLPSGASAVLSIDVLGLDAGTITNEAHIISSDQLDAVITNNRDEAVVFVGEVLEPYAELSLTKTVNANAIMQNETTRFDILISNAGPDAATNVSVEDILPEGLEYLNHNTTVGNYDAGTGVWTMLDLPSGASAVLSIEVLGVDAGTITNEAHIISSDQLDAVITNNRDEAVVFVGEVLEPYAELSLTKTVNANAIMQNETTRFDILISNAGPDAATNVSVEDILPQGLDYINHNTTVGNYDASTGIWTMLDLAVGASAVLSIEVLGVDAGTITNEAHIISSDQLDAVITNNRDEAVVFVGEVLEPYAELSLTKTVNANAIMQNETTRFDILISNAGPDAATNVSVEDILPQGLEYITHTTTVGNYDASTGIWTMLDLAVGASAVLSIEVLGVDAGTITNEAHIISSDQLDAVITNNRDEAVVFVGEVLEPYAELSLTKTVNANAIMQNESTRFDILISNAGPDAATNVSIEDILPQGLEYISHNTTVGNYDANTGVWTMLDLPASASAVLSIEVLGVDAGTITNEAHIISSDQLDAVITNNRDEALVFVGEVLEPYAELSLTKTVNANAIMQNESTRFDILISNAGPDAATNVSVEDILPQGLAYINHSTTVGNYDTNTGLWTMLDLAVGASAVLSIEVLGVDAGTITNEAHIISSDQLDAVITNNRDEAVVFVGEVLEPYAELSLTKTVNANAIMQNESTRFDILISNAGPDAATNVSIEDILPQGLQYINHNTTVGNYDTSTGLWTMLDLPSGASAVLSIEVLGVDAGTITNEAHIISSDQLDAVITNNKDEAVVFVGEVLEPLAELSITKTANKNVILQNESVIFQIMVSNAGPDDASNITIEESLPIGLEYVIHQNSEGVFDVTQREWKLNSLPVGASAVMTIEALGLSSGTLTNRVSITNSDQLDPVSTNNQDEALVFVTEILEPYAELSLTKTVKDNLIMQNDSTSFDILISNAGPDAATNVVVEDILPPGLNYLTHNTTVGDYNEATGQWNMPDLQAGASELLTIEVHGTAFGSITNQSSIISSDQLDAVLTNNVDEAIVFISSLPEEATADLSINKTVNVNTIFANDENAVFTILISNAGPNNASNIVVEEILPPGLSYVSHTASSGTYNFENGDWTMATLEAENFAELSIVVVGIEGGNHTNIARIKSSDQRDAVLTNNSSRANLLVEGIAPLSADLSLNKRANVNAILLNEEVEFTITLFNAGPANATNVEIAELLPEGLSLTAHSFTTGSYSAQDGLWLIPLIPASSFAELKLTTSGNQTGLHVNNASILNADQLDENDLNNTADASVLVEEILVEQRFADLSIQISPDTESMPVNDALESIITIHNNGPDEATNIVVSQIIPPNLTLMDEVRSNGIFYELENTWNISSLLPGESAELKIILRANEPGVYSNRVYIENRDQIDENELNDSAVSTIEAYIVEPNPSVDLSIIKKIDKNEVDINDTVEFTITVENLSEVEATNIIIEENLPDELTYISNESDVGDYSVENQQWLIESLPASSKAELSIKASTTIAGNFTNEVKIVSIDQLDTNVLNNKAFADVQVNERVELPKEIDLILTKLVNQEVVFEKDTVEFLIVLSNIGPDEATGIKIEENFPDGLKYVNVSTSLGAFDQDSGIWSIASLPVFGSAQLIIKAQAVIPGDYSNYVRLLAVDQIDVGSTNNSAQANVGIRALPKANLSILKNVESASIESGERTSFVITLENKGPDVAYDIIVDELWPTQLLYKSHNESSGIYDADSKEWRLDFLDVNESANLTIQTQGVTPGNFRNAVAIRSSSPLDEDDTDNVAAINLIVRSPEPADACVNPFECDDVKACVEAASSLTICPDFCIPGNFEIEKTSGAVNGSIEVNGRCLEYSPFLGVNNTSDELMIEAINEQNVCAEMLYTLEIKDCTNNNVQPVILNDETNFCAAPVQTVEICVEAEDTNNDNLSICEIKTHFDCTIGDINDLCFFYTPLPGIVGTRNVSIKICDDGLPELSTIANYTVDVRCIEPVANEDDLVVDNEQANFNNTITSIFNGAVIFDPTLNDENESTCFPDFFIHAITKGATYGEEMLVNGTIQYKPDEGFVGTDEIEYEICNACGNCATAIIRIEANMCASIQESCAQPQIENEICIEFCEMSASIQEVNAEDNNMVENITQRCFDYTPLMNTQSIDTVKVVAVGETGNQETAFAYILVDETCLNPLAENDTAETRENQFKTISILSNDAPNTQTFFVNIIEKANFGAVYKNLDGTVTYQPDYGFIGKDEFTYWLCNAYDLCSQAKVEIMVEDDLMPNIEAVDDHLITNVNQPLRINVLANDAIANGLEASVTNSGIPKHGTNILYNNTISYNPPTGFVGKDEFVYTICNAYGDCDQAEVTITIYQKEEIINNTSEFIPSADFNIRYVFAANDLIHLNIQSNKPKTLQYEIINMMGKVLLSGKLNAKIGNNQMKLPYVYVASQIVLLRLYDKEDMVSKKLFIE